MVNMMHFYLPQKKEAPNLKYPRFKLGTQKMCFFTSYDNPWVYKGPSSLSGMQIGIAKDTSVEELDNFIKLNQKLFQYQPYHERYVIQNAKKLLKKRIDAFIFTENTTNFELKNEKIDNLIKNAGCVSNANIFMALTAEKSKEHHVSKILSFFDRKMIRLKETGYIDKLFKKYNLE
jgi:polar amino acid transport system substrate-binding protein